METGRIKVEEAFVKPMFLSCLVMLTPAQQVQWMSSSGLDERDHHGR